jgi:hypothetical protein
MIALITEMSANFYEITWRNIREGYHLHIWRRFRTDGHSVASIRGLWKRRQLSPHLKLEQATNYALLCQTCWRAVTTVSRTRALHCSARERTAEWTRTALIMWRSVVKKPAIGTSARHDSWIMNKLWARCWNSRVLRLECHQPQEINVSNRLITETSKLQSYVKQGYQMNYWNILHSNDLYNSFCRYDTTIWSHCKHCTKI